MHEVHVGVLLLNRKCRFLPRKSEAIVHAARIEGKDQFRPRSKQPYCTRTGQSDKFLWQFSSSTVAAAQRFISMVEASVLAEHGQLTGRDFRTGVNLFGYVVKVQDTTRERKLEAMLKRRLQAQYMVGCPFNSYPNLSSSESFAQRTGLPLGGLDVVDDVDDSLGPAAAHTLDGCIEYCIRLEVDAAATATEMKKTSAADVLKMLDQHLGQAWTTDYIGTGEVTTKFINDRVRQRLRDLTGKGSNVKTETMLRALHTKWKTSRHPRFFRGQRVLARAQDQELAKVNAEYTSNAGEKDWYPARVIGVGSVENTFELLYDEQVGGKLDRHQRVFPYLAKNPSNASKAFREGKQLGTGLKMIQEANGEFTWDSVLLTQ
eukprot:SAG31_NODE_151_length_22216_cov_37.572139_10_plen_375_part_00